ncbi:MAG TPA: GNAT family N-acetyltransferase [Candidatus Acidoferrum sp.]|nr:GNAT family N-acetyltransferase [Candidatus Methylomirabilis sp.]HWU38789.1 GNAT family N-acetyltransferase [Candidatus Acidoferrum sp.]
MGLKGFPQILTLRDGSTLTARPSTHGDEPALLAFYRELPQEERLFLKDDVTTESWAERFLQRIERGEAVSLLAEKNGKVLAEATLYRPQHGWSRHVGEVRVAVASNHRRKGVATALLRLLVRLASDQGVEKIVVEVVENQTAALRTFAKLGFQREAVLSGHVKDIKGIRRDLLILVNDSSHLWAAIEAMLADSIPGAG